MPFLTHVLPVVVTTAFVGTAIAAVRMVLDAQVRMATAPRPQPQFATWIGEATPAAGLGQSRGRPFLAPSPLRAPIAARTTPRVIAAIRGVRIGALALLQRWRARLGPPSRTEPEVDAAGEQRWLDDGGPPAGVAIRPPSNAPRLPARRSG